MEKLTSTEGRFEYAADLVLNYGVGVYSSEIPGANKKKFHCPRENPRCAYFDEELSATETPEHRDLKLVYNP